MEKKYMEVALHEAQKSYKIGDVPVGAVIVKNGKIISRAHNKKEKTQIVTHHAEIIAMQKACAKLKSWRLDDCILYVTLEPCLMCYGAILQSRISKVVYATTSQKYGFRKIINNSSKNNKNVVLLKGICEKKSQKLLKDFFKDKRD